MTEKRYMIEEIGNMFRVLKDNEPLTTKFENTDKIDVINLVEELNELAEENKELKEINQDNQDYISSLEEEKNNLQIKLQKIRDYAMEDGEVKQGVIEKVMWND